MILSLRIFDSLKFIEETEELYGRKEYQVPKIECPHTNELPVINNPLLLVASGLRATNANNEIQNCGEITYIEGYNLFYSSLHHFAQYVIGILAKIHISILRNKKFLQFLLQLGKSRQQEILSSPLRNCFGSRKKKFQDLPN